MSTKFSLFFIALFMVLNSSAQSHSLRDVVAIVRPVYSESTTAFLRNFSRSLAEEGYDTASVEIKSYEKGSTFGSGFAYTNPKDSQVYIVTNRHVVTQAQSVDIEFALEDQSIKSFHTCKIVSIDDDHDLALIALPFGAKIENTIQISTDKPSDGDDVFTAGYPGLSSKPSWQLGKGIVSNSNIHIDELMISNSGIIQHTAQVDPGSSGGPLLRRNSNMPKGFEIVGINTWKAKGRENVNLAIPASVIMAFINKSLNEKTPQTKEELQKVVNNFIDVKKDGYAKILPYISYDYIANISVKSFFELLGSANVTVKKEVEKQFNNGYPIEGVRMIIANAISTKIAQQELLVTSIENFSENSSVSVILSADKKSSNSLWVSEYGRWRLTNLTSLKINDLSEKKIATDYGYGSSYSLWYNSSLQGKAKGSEYYELITGRTIYTFCTYEIGLNFGSLYTQKTYNDNTKSSELSEFGGVEFLLGGELPIRVGSFYIIPYLKGIIGMDLPVGPEYGFKIGTEVAYKIMKSKYLILGLGYRQKSLVNMDETDNSKFSPISTLTMNMTVTF